MLQVIAKEQDLDLPSRSRYDEQIARMADPLLHDLVREKYHITGDAE